MEDASHGTPVGLFAFVLPLSAALLFAMVAVFSFAAMFYAFFFGWFFLSNFGASIDFLGHGVL